VLLRMVGLLRHGYLTVDCMWLLSFTVTPIRIFIRFFYNDIVTTNMLGSPSIFGLLNTNFLARSQAVLLSSLL